LYKDNPEGRVFRSQVIAELYEADKQKGSKCKPFLGYSNKEEFSKKIVRIVDEHLLIHYVRTRENNKKPWKYFIGRKQDQAVLKEKDNIKTVLSSTFCRADANNCLSL